MGSHDAIVEAEAKKARRQLEDVRRRQILWSSPCVFLVAWLGADADAMTCLFISVVFPLILHLLYKYYDSSSAVAVGSASHGGDRQRQAAARMHQPHRRVSWDDPLLRGRREELLPRPAPSADGDQQRSSLAPVAGFTPRGVSVVPEPKNRHELRAAALGRGFHSGRRAQTGSHHGPASADDACDLSVTTMRSSTATGALASARGSSSGDHHLSRGTPRGAANQSAMHGDSYERNFSYAVVDELLHARDEDDANANVASPDGGASSGSPGWGRGFGSGGAAGGRYGMESPGDRDHRSGRDASSAEHRGLHVRFEPVNRSLGSGGNDRTPTSELTRLGIRDVGTSTYRTREWVRDILAQVSEDIRSVDRLLGERQLLFLECSTHLSEQTEPPKPPDAPAAGTGGFGAKPAGTGGFGSGGGGFGSGGGGFGGKPAGGFGTTGGTGGFGGGGGGGTTGGFGQKPAGSGGGFGAAGGTGGGFGAAAQPKQVTKLDYIQLEKHRITNTAQHVPDSYKLAETFDRRMQLEALLDITLTFRESERSPEASSDRQAYVVRRIATLAQQPGLAGYAHARGDPELWTSTLPCDAHIIAHVLRFHHPALARHIRMGYEQQTERNEISVCIGNDGEPCFFVRYRQHGIDTTLPTERGRDSLFHALLLFAGLIASNHDGAYGGVFGVVDLDRLKLSNVL